MSRGVKRSPLCWRKKGHESSFIARYFVDWEIRIFRVNDKPDVSMICSRRSQWWISQSVLRSTMYEYSNALLLHLITYYPLLLTIVNTILNGWILIILFRKKFRQRPTTHYMRAVALADLFMIYGWNLDHFFRFQFGFEVDRLNIFTCKIFLFFNNGFLQSAAWFRVWLCIDRFHTLQRISQRRTMAEHRSALLLIVLTMFFFALLNLHIPIFSCHQAVRDNQTIIVSDSIHYKLYPMWSYVNLVIYNLLPFLLMVIFDIRIVRHLILIKRSSTVQCSRVQHMSIALSILLSAFLFFLMTTPATIIFIIPTRYFPSSLVRTFVIAMLDYVQYTYHSISFVVYFVTLIEFRAEFYRLMPCPSFIRTRSSRTNGKRAKIYLKNSAPIATLSKWTGGFDKTSETSQKFYLHQMKNH